MTVRTLNVTSGFFRVKSWSTVSDLRAMIAQDMEIPSWSQGLALSTLPVARKGNQALLPEMGVNSCNATFTVARLEKPRVTLCTMQGLFKIWDLNGGALA